MGRERTYEIDGVKVSSREARRHVRRRDGDLCHVCGRLVLDGKSDYNPEQATLDHIVEHAAGGSNDVANIKLAHRKCNEQRSVAFGQSRQPQQHASLAKRREYRAQREARSMEIYRALHPRHPVA